MPQRLRKPRKYDLARRPARPRRIASRAAQDKAAAEPRPNEMLHLGGWIAALNLTQSKVAEDSGYGRAYINNLINPKTDKHRNPSALAMLRISRAMNVTVNDLYEPPPSKVELQRMRRYQPGTLGSLIDAGS